MEHLSPLKRDKPTLHHSIQDRKKPIDLLFAVDDFDNHR